MSILTDSMFPTETTTQAKLMHETGGDWRVNPIMMDISQTSVVVKTVIYLWDHSQPNNIVALKRRSICISDRPIDVM